MVVTFMEHVNGVPVVSCIGFSPGGELLTCDCECSQTRPTEQQASDDDLFDESIKREELEASHDAWLEEMNPSDNPFYDDNLDMDQQGSRFWDQY